MYVIMMVITLIGISFCFVVVVVVIVVIVVHFDVSLQSFPFMQTFHSFIRVFLTLLSHRYIGARDACLNMT